MKIGKTIYLDHQATTPVDNAVFAEMAPYFEKLFGNPHSVDHSIGWRAAKAVDEAAGRVGRLLGADTDEIVFTSGATESNNLALLGLGRRAGGGKRWRILMSAVEHKCVLAVGRVLEEQFGCRTELLPVDSEGFVDLAALEEAISDDVLAVSIMAVNNEIGTIQDVSAVSEIVRERGAIFHCDAAQAPCALDLGQFAQSVDLLSLSSHKMYGPQGVGALFVRRELQDRVEPLAYGGGQQRGLRSGTTPVALCVGMGAAAALFDQDVEHDRRASLRKRTDTFVGALLSLPWLVSRNGPTVDRRHPGNANIRFSGFDARDVLASVQPRLAASTGSACTSGIPEPSHVLRAIGLSQNEADASIRFSLGRETTNADLKEAVDLLNNSLSRLAAAETS